MKTATFIKDVSANFRGTAKVYELSESLDGHDWVVVSKVYTPISGHETYIFGWDRLKDEPISFSELEGSVRGDYSIEEVLQELGYEIK